VRGRSELLLLGDRVDLDHHPVDLVVDGVPVLLPALAEHEHLLQRVNESGGRVHRQPGLLEVLQRLQVRGEALPFRVQDPVTPQPERPGRADLRILLAEGAGSGIPGVGEDPSALLAELLVQLLERLHRKVHLAPDVQDRRVA